MQTLRETESGPPIAPGQRGAEMAARVFDRKADGECPIRKLPQGPEGAATSLLILKRRVKKLIEEEDRVHPLTDEQITKILQSQGIQVTRRTVAKYREDMRIPSTHQRRMKN